MTDAKRHQAIQALIKDYTDKHAVTKAAARETLIGEGIYTRKGALRVEFGGVSKKAKNAA